MIEQALFFAIGFLAAALAAVAAAPLLSRRAMRLAAARARLRAPATERQAIAEADALRAQHAVERARLERRLAFAEETSVGLRVAVGRQSAEIIRLTSDVVDLADQLYDQRAKVETLASRERDLRATVGAAQIALNDTLGQRDRAFAARDAAEARAAELNAEASRVRARTAVVAARAEYLEGRVEDLTQIAKAARDRGDRMAADLEVERGRAASLEARLDATTAVSQGQSERLSRANSDHRRLVARIAELEERLRLSERAREETLLENGRQLAALADLEAAMAVASEKAAGLEARLAALAAEASERDNASSLRTETLPAQAAMEGSLRTARAEREALQRENDALRNRIAHFGDASRAVATDAELRNSIERLGREVSRLFAEKKSSGGKESSGGEGKTSGGRAGVAALASADGGASNPVDSPRRRAGRSPER